MKCVLLPIFLLAQNLLFSQIFSEDYFYIQSENKKCKLTIDTLIVDTTFHFWKNVEFAHSENFQTIPLKK